MRRAAVLLLVCGTAAAAPARVEVDPRIELLSILFRVAGNPEFNRTEATPYAKAVDGHFNAFENHPAVTASAELRNRFGIGYNAVPALAVYLDASFRPIRPLAPLPPRLDDRWKDAPIDAYLAKVRDFAAQTRFADFMKQQAGYRAAVAARMAGALADRKVDEFFTATFGGGGTATIVPGLLTGPMNYGLGAERPDGKLETYQVVMLERPDADGLPRPGDLTVDLLVHETAHSFVNPVMDARSALLEPPAAKVFAMVGRGMKVQRYIDWPTMVNESVVRAVTILYVGDRRGAAAAAQATRDEQGRSFLWMPELVTALDRVRKIHAGKLPAEDMAAAARGVLADFLDKNPNGPPKLPFAGPIGAVLPQGPTVVTASTPALRAFVVKMAAGLKWKPPVDAAAAGLPAGPLIVYGSAASIPALAPLFARFGWSIGAKGVSIGGKRFDGPHLAVIACHGRPDDPTAGILFYTAAADEDVVGINYVTHGPTDWVVARRKPDGSFETLGSGDF
jgi:uncharacterized protein DUF4932